MAERNYPRGGTAEREREAPAAPPRAYNGTTTESDGGRGGGGAMWAAAAIIVGLLIWAVWATWFDGSESQQSGPDVGVTLQELSDNPSEFIGSRVVVSGQINTVTPFGNDGGAAAQDGAAITANAQGGALRIGQDANVLVLAPNIPAVAQLGNNQDLAESDIVQVSGTVRAFEQGLLTDTFGDTQGFNQDAGIFSDAQEGQAVIVADSISLVPTAALQQGENVQVTTSALVDNPQEYFGMNVTISDAQVTSQIGDGAWEIGDNQSLLILGQNAGLQQGQQGTVSGVVVEPSTAALMRQLGLSQNQQDDLFSQFGLQEGFEFESYNAVLLASGGSATTQQGGTIQQGGATEQGGATQEGATGTIE